MQFASGTLLGALLWACIPQLAHAVKPGEVSKTAHFVCEYRAIAAQHPDLKLRNLDEFADKLCPRSSQLPRAYAEARTFINNVGVTYAPYFFVNARTLYIEAALQRAAAAFAKRQGLKVVEDLGTKELTQRYLTGSDGKPDGRMPDGHRILQAQVP